MKRRVAKVVRRILPFLLLGAILNVGVAWGACIWQGSDSRIYIRSIAESMFGGHSPWGPNPDASTEELVWLENLGWTKTPDSRCVRIHVFVFEQRTAAFAQRDFVEEPELLCDGRVGSDGIPFAIRTSAGWPMKSIGDVLTQLELNGGMMVGRWSHRHAIDLGDHMNPSGGWNQTGAMDHYTLPTRAIWPGFAINTIFYASILWLPFAALGAFQRRRRIKRGLCPACGYDLRGSDSTCPECGKAVKA